MKILLISKKQIVIQIFELVCKKLNFELSIAVHNEINKKYDIIVVDDEFIDDRFPIIKQLSKRIGAITDEDLSSKCSDYFSISNPFLPTNLIELLKEQEEVVKNAVEHSKRVEIEEVKLDEETLGIASFVDSLDDDIRNEKEDESIVTFDLQKDEGGVLDSSELSKITDMLSQNNDLKNVKKDDENLDIHDFKNLSQIVDDALKEVKSYEFDLAKEPLSLIISKENGNDLRPLLKTFDKDSTNDLLEGKSVDVRVSLKGKE